jgi:glycolate oxidase
MIEDLLVAICGSAHVDLDVALSDDWCHDEALGLEPVRPLAVAHPATTDQVVAIVQSAAQLGVPLTARGSGTGLSGASVPVSGGIVVSFDRMAAICEIDEANQVAVVEPGVTLVQLDAVLAPLGLVYPVFPGEQSASIGGNVATNAGGMRAVKYGVTRHHVLGLEAVLGTGEVITTGGRFVKATSGYDLTQLIIGSEGTLALVTRAILRLHPRPGHQSTLLAPFATLGQIADAVPPVLASGVGPLLVEYIDTISMAGITANAGIDLGIPGDVRTAALAYLIIVLEGHHADRVAEDTESLAAQLTGLGALDVYVLPDAAGVALIGAREHAFWASKAAGADDIIDVVVPRATIPFFLADVGELAARTGSLVVGCGHAGDGNVHLSVFQPDIGVRHRLVHNILTAGVALGGAVSGEHGIGTAKLASFTDLEDPVKIDLMRRIKTAFDPTGILNPGKVFSPTRKGPITNRQEGARR